MECSPDINKSNARAQDFSQFEVLDIGQRCWTYHVILAGGITRYRYGLHTYDKQQKKSPSLPRSLVLLLRLQRERVYLKMREALCAHRSRRGLFLFLSASLALSLDYPFPPIETEFDMVSMVNRGQGSAPEFPLGTVALVKAFNPEVNRVYSIRFNNDRSGITYRVEFLSSLYAPANGFKAVDANGLVLLAAARGGSSPPPFNSGSGMPFNLTFFANAADAGPGPKIRIWKYDTALTGVPQLKNGEAIRPCAKFSTCVQCLRVPGCSFCADESGINPAGGNKIGVCQWTGLSLSAGGDGLPIFKTRAAPPWACRANETQHDTCNKGSAVRSFAAIKREYPDDAAAGPCLTVQNVSTNEGATPTSCSKITAIDFALMSINPAPNTPSGSSGSVDRFTIYAAVILCLHIVTGLMIRTVYMKYSQRRSAGRGEPPITEFIGVLLLIARTLELYASLLLDCIAATKLHAVTLLLRAEPGYLTPPDAQTAQVLAGIGYAFPGSEYFDMAQLLLRTIFLFAGDAGVVLAPPFIMSAMPKKILSARLVLMGGVQKDSTLRALYRLVPAAFLGFLIAVITHLSRWAALVTARGGPLSFENAMERLNTAEPSSWIFRYLLPYELFHLCSVDGRRMQPDGGIYPVTQVQWYSGVFAIGSFLMFLTIIAGVVETLSGVARMDVDSTAPVRFVPALVVGVGASVAAMGLPVEMMTFWALLCTTSASDDYGITTIAADSRFFSAYIVAPSVACMLGCLVFTAGARWQTVLDSRPPVADLSPGILLNPEDVGDFDVDEKTTKTDGDEEDKKGMKKKKKKKDKDNGQNLLQTLATDDGSPRDPKAP